MTTRGFPSFSWAKSASVEAICKAASEALDREREEDAIPLVEAALASQRNNASLWQWLGLLYRGLDDRAAAISAYEKACLNAPQDPKIVHGHARVVLEAGLPAVDLFEKALRLAPNEGDVILGLAAAKLAIGAGDQALDDLDGILNVHPFWLQGQRERIQLAWILGRGDQSFDTIKSALRSAPRDIGLWQTGILALAEAGMYDAALGSIRGARRQTGNSEFLNLNEAVALSELGRAEEADLFFNAAERYDDIEVALHLVRHDLRNDRLDAATRRLEAWIGRPEADAFWPYASIAWRLCDDERYDWLEGDQSLVQSFDLADKLPPLEKLAQLLRGLHQSRFAHLDQSVRGGTQTDGVLLSRVEPEIRQLRAVLADAVTAYIQALPAIDPKHPTLRHERDRKPRFSGSWSVRLSNQGYHANHVHPAGWVSSALYIALPAAGENQEGWLAFGVPQDELGLKMKPTRSIEPKPGRLVLFPSTMWHGTVPFNDGERLTVAFDVTTPSR
jgi:tetratricopeptide (TPR) repeat protein